MENNNGKKILDKATELRIKLGEELHDSVMESIYAEAATIAGNSVDYMGNKKNYNFDRLVDKIVTSRYLGFPIMFLLLALVFWLTIIGANVPSQMIASVLVDIIHPALRTLFIDIGIPSWITGLFIDGAYLAGAWVVSVMLPPMAIFFPLFTFLEDLGYLPRVAFNMDNLFRKAGAH